MLQYLHFLSYDETKLEVQAVLQRNCCFAHPESILLVVVVDSNEATANDALMKIQKTQKSNNATSLRIFSKQDNV